MSVDLIRKVVRIGLTRRLLLAAGLLLPLFSSLPQAAEPAAASPTTAVKSTVDNILLVLRKPDYNLMADRPAIRAEIRKSFDDLAMAQSVLSTNWKNLAADKQSEFKELLMQTIESTYIGRIKTYSNETVEFGKETINENRATVDTLIVSSSGNVPVNYKLRKRSDGWFIYDVEVENVSMVSSYRDTYRSIFTKDGIDGLLSQMKAKIAEMEG